MGLGLKDSGLGLEGPGLGLEGPGLGLGLATPGLVNIPGVLGPKWTLDWTSACHLECPWAQQNINKYSPKSH